MKVNKKRRVKLDERYNSIMNVLARKVKRIIENCDACDDEFDECDRFDECGDEEFDEDTFECNENFRRNRSRRYSRLYEMAKTVIDRKILANVRDKISRNGWDSPYGINWRKVVSLPRKFTPDELLQYYVAALLVYGEDCPQTEADIDKIGVFTNYAHKLIDDYGFTIDDIKDFYGKNEKIQSKSRRGSSRGSKAYRATKDNPDPNMNFDSEESDGAEEPTSNNGYLDNIPDADIENDYTDEKQFSDEIDNDYEEDEDIIDNEPEDVIATDDGEGGEEKDFPSYEDADKEDFVEDDDEPVEDDDDVPVEDDDDIPVEDDDDIPVDDDDEPVEDDDIPDYDDVPLDDEDGDEYEEDVESTTSNRSDMKSSKPYPDYDDVPTDGDDDEYEEIVDDDVFNKSEDEREDLEDQTDFADYDENKSDRVLDIEDEDKKPSEYTFEDIINPNFNEVVHNYNPEKFKLDDDGRIGFDVFKYETIDEANKDFIPSNREASFTIWGECVAHALLKVQYLCEDTSRTFGQCDKQVASLIKVIRRYQPKFNELISKYFDVIDHLKKTDTWFLDNENRVSNGDIKVVGNDCQIVLDMFDHIDKECPFEKLVGMKARDFDSKYDFDEITNIDSNEEEIKESFRYGSSRRMSRRRR